MRIGIDASILAPRTRDSGIGRYVRRLVDATPRLAPNDLFVLFAPAACPRPTDLPANVVWQALPLVPLGKLSVPAAYFSSLPQCARSWRLDVFHAPTVHPRPSWPPVPRRLPCPLVVTIHDLIPLTFYASGPSRLPRTHLAFYRWNLSAAASAAAIITVSEAERQTIIDRLRLPSHRVSAIYNGVDPAATAANASACHPVPYVLFVGSFEARKNLAGAVRAYGRAASHGLAHDLVVVATSGSGPTAPVDAAVRECGLRDRVRFIDGRAIGDAELHDLYAHAEMFVFPSLAESFGLPPLEAMAAGVPVIASGLPALREVLGDAACYVDARDERALADAMRQVAADPGARRRMSGTGMAWARQYSWEACAAETLEVYRHVAGVPERRRAEAGMVAHR